MTKKPTLRFPQRYIFRGTVYLPADAGWREFARQKDIAILETSPDGLFQSTIREVVVTITEKLSEADTNTMAFGMTLNMIQKQPTETRRSLVAAIKEGLVMTTFEKNGEVIVDLQKEVDAFDIETGERRSSGGIILPGM